MTNQGVAFVGFSLLFNLLVYGQAERPSKNIAPNGGFENYKKKSENIKSAIPWTGIASVDYYQKPLSNDTSACKGAHSGLCFAGLRFQKRYKEFLEVKLAEPLKRGGDYQFECYIKLGFWSNAALKSFGAYFSKGGLKAAFPEKENIVDTIAKKGELSGKFCWFRVKGNYRAGGGEKYLTIGNFSPKIARDMVRMNIFKRGFKEAYYFIDDVSLKWIPPKGEEVKVVYVDSIKYEKDSVLQVSTTQVSGEKITLKVDFQQGKSLITSESYPELNKTVQYLVRHPDLGIQINGHSDNTGSKRRNMKLSAERARAVFEYLITKGVQNRMTFVGFGDTLPIGDNLTDEGRAKNRRVEIEVVKIPNG